MIENDLSIMLSELGNYFDGKYISKANLQRSRREKVRRKEAASQHAAPGGTTKYRAQEGGVEEKSKQSKIDKMGVQTRRERNRRKWKEKREKK